MGRKVGAAVTLLGELSPNLTQCRLDRGTSPYQVVSSSIQPFGHNTSMLQTDRQVPYSIGRTVTYNGRPKTEVDWLLFGYISLNIFPVVVSFLLFHTTRMPGMSFCATEPRRHSSGRALGWRSISPRESAHCSAKKHVLEAGDILLRTTNDEVIARVPFVVARTGW